jgi:hypothetical protein
MKMKKVLIGFAALAMLSGNAFAEGKIKVTKPADGETVTVPFEVCFSATGLEVVKAGKDKTEGKGHHHILIDVDPVKDSFDAKNPSLNKYGKGTLLHLSKGGDCQKVTKPLTPGKHMLSGVFTYNNHIPYDPIISDTITINVGPGK